MIATKHVRRISAIMNFHFTRGQRLTLIRSFLLTIGWLMVATNVANAALLRFYVDVSGGNEHVRKESLVAPMSHSLSGFDSTPPFGTLEWDVFASCVNGALAA